MTIQGPMGGKSEKPHRSLYCHIVTRETTAFSTTATLVSTTARLRILCIQRVHKATTATAQKFLSQFV